MKWCVWSQRLKKFFWNLQQMTKVMRLSCWHQNVGPNGLSAPAQGLYTCIKMCINSDRAIFRNMQSVINEIKPFCFQQRMSPCQILYQAVVYPCPGAFFKRWLWVDLEHFYESVKFCFLILLYSLNSIECSCISKFCSNSAYPQHSGEQNRTNGPLVLNHVSYLNTYHCI